MKCPKCETANSPDSQFCKACATPLSESHKDQVSFTRTIEAPPDELRRGMLFGGRFEVIEELGRGGMGRVYRAFDKKIGEEIALKVLRPEIALDEKAVDRFRNEIKLARKITHRHVCRMHDLHEQGKTLFITMEYVAGRNLKSLIQETGALAVGTAVSIAKQVAEGLAEAHDLGVIHRDLKPQNIMVDDDGQAKVMDFGIARSLWAAGTTVEGMVIGTPEYMAPEQVEGKETDQRTDIYALGAILFEMVTGRLPFEGDSPLSVAYKHKNEAPQPPRKINPRVSEPLNKLILRCLEKKGEHRYQTADEFLTDLERIEDGLPMSERVILKSRSTHKIAGAEPSRWKRFLIPAAGALLLALIALVGLRVLPHKAPDIFDSDKPSVAVLYFHNLSGDPSLDPWTTGLTELLITDLSQSRRLRVIDGNRVYSILKKFKLDEAGHYSREDLVKVADEGGAAYTASGSLMTAGESIIIMLTLQKPHSGEVVESVKVVCQGEAEILPKTDELAAKIKAGIKLSAAQIAADAGPGIRETTTDSPEALKYYVEGLRHFRMLEVEKAVALCDKAVEIDPQFAAAYVILAAGNEMLGNTAKGRDLRKRAYNLRDRLQPRERYLVEANYYITQPEPSTAQLLKVWEKYFELAPDDVDELESRSIVYANRFEDYEKSLEQMEFAYRIAPSPQLLDTLIRAYERLGFYDRAERAVEAYLETHESTFFIHYIYSCLYLLQRKFDLALSEIEKTYLIQPSPEWVVDKGIFYLLKGEAAEAEKRFLQVLSEEGLSSRKAGRRALCLLDLQAGRFGRASADLEKAMRPGGDLEGEFQESRSTYPSVPYVYLRSKQFDKALEFIDRRLRWAKSDDSPAYLSLAFQRIALWWKGLVLIEAKRLPEAEQTAEELGVLCERSLSKKNMRYYEHLQGLIALEQARYDKAIQNLRKAFSFLPFESLNLASDHHALFLYPLGLACYKAGDLDKAELEFGKITRLTSGRVAYGDLYARSFYMLGKIAEERRDKKRAAENYRRFLDLWKDADPGQPGVEDARNRLAKLGMS